MDEKIKTNMIIAEYDQLRNAVDKLWNELPINDKIAIMLAYANSLPNSKIQNEIKKGIG